MLIVIMILGMVPPEILLGAVVMLSLLGVRFLPWNRTLVVALISVLAVQTLILVAWMTSRTAAAVFDRSAFDANMRVFPPVLENILMPMLWFGILAGIWIVASRATSLKLPQETRRIRAMAVCWALAELFVTVAMWCNSINFRRMPLDRFNIVSVSPDRRWTIRLVPMNCMIDRNGLVIVRSSGEFWWHPVAELGDVLTEYDGARFDWQADSTRFTLVGHNRGLDRAQALLEQGL